jgi:hypothetical protein
VLDFDPPSVKPSEARGRLALENADTDSGPERTDDDSDPNSKIQRRKMKDALDNFLHRTSPGSP